MNNNKLMGEDLLNQLMAITGEGIWDWDMKTSRVTHNARWCEIFSLDESYLDHSLESFVTLLHEDDRDKVMGRIQACLDGEVVYQSEHRMLRSDGTIIWVQDRGDVIERDANGEAMRILGSIADITERKLAERELQDIKQTLDQTLDCVFMFDENSLRFFYVNEGALLQLGYSREEMLALHPYDIKPNLTELQFRQLIIPLLSGAQTSLQFETIHAHKNGKPIPVEISLQYVHPVDEPARFVAVVRDITERKLAEKVLRSQATIIDQIHDSVVSTDLQGSITSWNRGAERIFGYGRDEMLGQHIMKVYLEEDHPFLQNEIIVPLQKKGEHQTEVRMLRKSGTVFFAHLSMSMLYDEQGNATGMIGYTMDITERKQADDKLNETTQLLDGIVENVPNMIFLKRASDLCFEFFNSAGEIMLGVDRSELLGKNDYDFFPKEQANFFTTKDREVLSQQGVVDIPEETIETPNGARILHTQKITLRDEQGIAQYLLGISEDITERKYAEDELEKYRYHLEDLVAQRTSDIQIARDEAVRTNAAKSEFLSGMSHELRTPLNAILGFSQLMESHPTEFLSEYQMENVKEIKAAGQHLLILINEVLDLSRIESGQIDINFESVVIVPMIQDCLSQLQPLAAQRGIEIEFEPKNGCSVQADRTRLKQVLFNLLSNAIKYNRAGGQIQISCAPGSQQRLRINVKDTGYGITEEQIPRLFQPFERLGMANGTVEGTGIGLAVAKKMVEIMRGDIGVESEPGKGSTFWCELPLSVIDTPISKGAQSSVVEQVEQDEPKPITASKVYKLLYVEDNPANLRLVKKIIGSRVDLVMLEARTAEAGLEMVTQHQPDLILLDINLPGIDGFEALRQLKANSKTQDIPVIAVTANAMASDVERGKAAGFANYITKPLNIPLFIKMLDSCLKVN